ncbi:TauD/TfdA family dioxygenase [Leptothoe sp. EHU-05/26/07-4]
MEIKLLEATSYQPLCIEVSSTEDQNIEALLAWHQRNRELVEEKILKYGAILFRGFSINDPERLKDYVQLIFGNPSGYVDGNSPRSLVGDGVYTSTEYPAAQTITLHNELSYSHTWPEKLLFCCCRASQKGGETPIVDGRQLLKQLDGDILSALVNKKVMYIRNLHDGKGLGPSWQDTFETQDKAWVESYLQQDPACEYRWKNDSNLYIKQIRPAVVQHPISSEWVWFNQVDQFHLSSLGDTYYQALKKLYAGKEDDLPMNAYFGDGTLIKEEWIEKIRQTCLQESIRFPWQEGDLLIIDNMLTMHGRMPFEGDRKILVSIVGSHSLAPEQN